MGRLALVSTSLPGVISLCINVVLANTVKGANPDDRKSRFFRTSSSTP